MSTQNTTEFTFVTIEAKSGTETAVYTRRNETDSWGLLTIEKDRAHSSLATAQALNASIRRTTLMPHLRVGDGWVMSVPDSLMQPATPVQQVEAEIANLLAEARQRSESAGYSGSYGDDGAGHLRQRADGMQAALDILTADND